MDYLCIEFKSMILVHFIFNITKHEMCNFINTPNTLTTGCVDSVEPLTIAYCDESDDSVTERTSPTPSGDKRVQG